MMRKIYALIILFGTFCSLKSQSFSWTAKSDTVVSIPVADTIVVFDSELKNLSTRNLDVLIIKEKVSSTKNWPFYICSSGTCYSPNQDTVRLILASNELIDIKFDVDVIAPINGDNGTYKLTVINNLDPTDYMVKTYRVNVSQTSRAKKQDFTWSFFPNPVQNTINIKSNMTLKNVSVYSLLGEKIVDIPFKNSVDVSHLPAGIYILQVVDYKGNSSTQKFIKQ